MDRKLEKSILFAKRYGMGFKLSEKLVMDDLYGPSLDPFDHYMARRAGMNEREARKFLAEQEMTRVAQFHQEVSMQGAKQVSQASSSIVAPRSNQHRQVIAELHERTLNQHKELEEFRGQLTMKHPLEPGYQDLINTLVGACFSYLTTVEELQSATAII